MNTLVSDVMTTRVIWIRQDAPFREMAAALRAHGISAFPVLDEDETVIGVVSESDMLNKPALDGGEDGMPGMITGILRDKEQEKARGVTAGDLMTAPPVTVRPGDTLEHAARLMYTLRVRQLPVIDEAGHLAGIISRADVLSVFDRSDADIREDIMTGVLRHEFFDNSDAFAVTVKDGVVTLAGKPETGEAGREIIRMVRHVQGVVAVRDRLSYPPSGIAVGALPGFRPTDGMARNWQRSSMT